MCAVVVCAVAQWPQWVCAVWPGRGSGYVRWWRWVCALWLGGPSERVRCRDGVPGGAGAEAASARPGGCACCGSVSPVGVMWRRSPSRCMVRVRRWLWPRLGSGLGLWLRSEGRDHRRCGRSSRAEMMVHEPVSVSLGFCRTGKWRARARPGAQMHKAKWVGRPRESHSSHAQGKNGWGARADPQGKILGGAPARDLKC